MTIKEWLTPGLFDVNVILVALMINWTLYNIVSNFLEDFRIPARVQSINYTAVVVMSLAYAALVILHLAGVLENRPTLYPNRYDFMLMGNERALACIIAGLVVGGPIGYLFGSGRAFRIITGALAVIFEGLIVLFTLLWILAQE
jgi:hypothetical protein